MDQTVNRNHIREYFGGKSSKLSLLLFIIGLCFVWTIIVAVVLWAVALALWIKNALFSDYTYEDDVDKAMAYEFEKCKERSLEKLGLVKEQVSLIEPIFTTGKASYIPATATSDLAAKQLSKGFLGKLLGKKDFKKALKENDDDPISYQKIGSDDNLRYTLLCNTALYFGEQQVYIYYEDVDIATGLIYACGTKEYFYKDIEGISVNQTNTKMLNIKKKKYIRIINESFTISLSGSYYTGAFRSVTEGNTDPRIGDNQFAAMRTLIREKKNA